MTKDNRGFSYTYDAENHITVASGMTNGPYCYTYDAFGLRVEKAHANGGACSGTVTVDKLYWRSIWGDTIAETDGSGSTTNSAYKEYVFFAGRRIASRDGLGNIYYYYTDHLGTTRSITDSTGHVCYDADFDAYGMEIVHTNTCPQNYKFTGYERDPETADPNTGLNGLDYSFARYYSSSLGRFMSADPFNGAVINPQTLNRYAYVANNASNLTDPLGLICRVGASCPPSAGIPFQDVFGDISGVDSEGGIDNPFFSAYAESTGMSFLTGSVFLFGPGGGPGGGDGGVGGPNAPKTPCSRSTTFNVPPDIVKAELEAFGTALTQVSLTPTGDVVSAVLYTQTGFAVGGGASVSAGSTVDLQYSGPGGGFSLGITGGVISEQLGYGATAEVTSLRFNNGSVTEVSGLISEGPVPIPFTSDLIKAGLNSNNEAISGLNKISDFLSKCAVQ